MKYQTSLVTGGASGVGSAIVKQLAMEKGAKVYFTYCSSEKESEDLVKKYHNVESIRLDFKNKKSLTNLLTELDRLRPDILVHNATTGFSKNHFHKLLPSVFMNSFENNIIPVIAITQKFLSLAIKRRYGKIITILSSYLAGKPPIGLSAYVSEKSYLLSLCKAWATENARFGITSNCISPSTMITNFTKDVDERILDLLKSNNPTGRLLTPKEVAEAVAFFVKASPQINGVNLVINSATDIL